MREHDQVWPLAPAARSQRSDLQQEEAAVQSKKHRSRRCIKCFIHVAALLLILAIVILVLIFTVFRFKDPIITMNRFTVNQLELINGVIPKPGVNMSFIADVSVKNPNFASFKYRNTTTSLYYHGQLAGEARTGPGKARARRTLHMNVTVDVLPDKLISNPNLNADFASGLFPVTTYSRVPGRVKLVLVKKRITVKMNCSITFNISSQAIQTQKCKRNSDFF